GRAPGELRGAENRGVVRLVGVRAPGGVHVVWRLWRAADTARIEHAEARHVRAEVAVEAAEPEVARTLHQEGPALFEKDLERGPGHHVRVHLHPPQRRVRRRNEGE